jgi:hypothetical protein
MIWSVPMPATSCPVAVPRSRRTSRCLPIGYFGEGEEAESIAGQVALLTLLRDSGVTGAALHSLADLSEPSRQMIIEMIASAARMEGKQRGGEKLQPPSTAPGRFALDGLCRSRA